MNTCIAGSNGSLCTIICIMPSSVIEHIVYDENSHTLTIVFLSGAVYQYLKVPLSVYNEMRAARSKGTYLNTRIKGSYKFKKIQ